MEEWKEYRLEDLCDELSDGLHKAPKFVENGEYIFVNAKNLSNGKIVDVDKQKHTTYDEYLKYKIDLTERTILYSIDGTIGNLAKYNNEKCVLGKGACYLNIKKDVSSDYIYYQLQTPHFKRYIHHLTTGSTIGHISLKTMRNYSFFLPPLPTQQKIAAILSSLDDKIELNNKINTNLEQQAQALFKNWFVDFEPFGGKMPEGWKEVEFRDVCENITDGVHNTVVDDPNGEYLLLSCKNIKGGVLTISSSERKINKETFEKLRKRTKLAKGDILLSSVGTVGEMYLLNETPDNYEFQRSVAIIKPNTSLISHAFLYESMLFQKDTIIHSAHGAVQQCIFISDVGDFKTILPTLDVIDKFTNIIQPMLDTITANQHENQKLANIRDTLLPKLMNGEILLN